MTCYDIWEEHINAINKNGLRLSGVSGNHIVYEIKATCEFNDLKDHDLYILATKVTQLVMQHQNFQL